MTHRQEMSRAGTTKPMTRPGAGAADIDSAPATAMVSREEIVAGLRRLGVGPDSIVLVHASLRSFGHVEGGARTVVDALVQAAGTVLMFCGASDHTEIPAGPPGMARPHNAFPVAADWLEFDALVAAAAPYDAYSPVQTSARWLGAVSEELRRTPRAVRGPHPLYSFVAVGRRADELISAERADRMLGSLERAAALGGQVLLLGVGHTSNTTIHLGEQLAGRGRLYRYARGADGLWVELPNISGESHRFDDLEPALRPHTAETMIGSCRARLVPMTAVVDVTRRAIAEDPTVGLCDDPTCRCAAALGQYLSGVPGPLPAA